MVCLETMRPFSELSAQSFPWRSQVLSRLLSELFQEGQSRLGAGWASCRRWNQKRGWDLLGRKEEYDGEDVCLIPRASCSISLPPTAPLFYTQGSCPYPLLPLRSLYCLSFLSSFISVQVSRSVRLFETPRTAAHQASLSITNSWSLLKLMSIESVMPSSHLYLSCLLKTSAFKLILLVGILLIAYHL